MFNSAERERAIEKHIAKCEENQTNNQVHYAEITKEIRYLRDFIEEHMNNEEKEQKRTTNALESISKQLSKMELEVLVHSSNVELKIAQSRKEILERAYNVFATKEEVSQEIKGIKDRAKFIYSILAIVVMVSGWVYTNLFGRI